MLHQWLNGFQHTNTKIKQNADNDIKKIKKGNTRHPQKNEVVRNQREIMQY